MYVACTTGNLGLFLGVVAGKGCVLLRHVSFTGYGNGGIPTIHDSRAEMIDVRGVPNWRYGPVSRGCGRGAARSHGSFA